MSGNRRRFADSFVKDQGKRLKPGMTVFAARMDAIDRPQSTCREELALDFARPVLKPNGAILIKTYQGAGIQQLTESACRSFNTSPLRQT